MELFWSHCGPDVHDRRVSFPGLEGRQFHTAQRLDKGGNKCAATHFQYWVDISAVND